MGAAPVATPAITFDGMHVAGCNAGCAWLPSIPVKFLDLLNKPVSFLRRSTASASPDRESGQLHDPNAANRGMARPVPPPASPPALSPASPLASQAIQPEPRRPPAQPVPEQQDHEQLALLSQQIDEAALLFATGQPEAAADLLDTALSIPSPQPGDIERRAWWMLLELHEAQGSQAGFDRTALAYAQRFEASPPQWRTGPATPLMVPREPRAATPLLLRLGQRLDAGAQTMLTQWQQRSATATELALDLAPATAIDLAGCRQLLALLAEWQQRGIHIDLRPCDPMLAMLRALIQSGRRDEDDAGWRLLIELLRLAGDVERYEDACIAYSLTYEMSPPAAPPPAVNERSEQAARAQARHRAPAGSGPDTGIVFTLPEVISLPIDPVLVALRAQLRQAGATLPSLVLDASRLRRIDFHAAGPLQSSLAELAAGKPVEWQGVSFLVSTLLQLTRGSTMPGIINRQP